MTGCPNWTVCNCITLPRTLAKICPMRDQPFVAGPPIRSACCSDDPVRTTTKDGGRHGWSANSPALTHGRPYRGFGWFPLPPDIGEHAKRASESRRANAAYVGKALAVPARMMRTIFALPGKQAANAKAVATPVRLGRWGRGHSSRRATIRSRSATSPPGTPPWPRRGYRPRRRSGRAMRGSWAAYYLGANWRRRVEHVGAKPAADLGGPLIV
jgi:hypothetical protein